MAGAAAMYLAALILFVTMAFDEGRAFWQPLDDAWNDLMSGWENDAVVVIAKALDIMGGVFVTAPLRVAMGLYLAISRRWWLLGTWIGADALIAKEETV